MSGRNEELDVEDHSSYTLIMLDRFISRYDELAAVEGAKAGDWQSLSLPVRRSLAGALVEVADEIQDDMY
jgi:hypothetical protein